MWYELGPCIAVLFVLAAAPTVLNYHIVKYWRGTPYGRDQTIGFNRMQYIRDMRLNGDSYKIQGLEVIPDEEE